MVAALRRDADLRRSTHEHFGDRSEKNEPSPRFGETRHQVPATLPPPRLFFRPRFNLRRVRPIGGDVWGLNIAGPALCQAPNQVGFFVFFGTVSPVAPTAPTRLNPRCAAGGGGSCTEVPRVRVIAPEASAPQCVPPHRCEERGEAPNDASAFPTLCFRRVPERVAQPQPAGSLRVPLRRSRRSHSQLRAL
jgi:hypothetical protein